MKKIVIIVFWLLIVVNFQSASAQYVSNSMAMDAAQNWLQGRTTNQIQTSHQLLDQDGTCLAYCFDLSPQGYIILTANQSLPPIIAYSFQNNYTNASIVQNPLEDMIIRDIGSRMGFYENAPPELTERNRNIWETLMETGYSQKSFEQWPPAGSTSTGGWLETNWKQSAPYNKFCPLDQVTSNRRVAGCPAVALAMVIHYQKNLNSTQFSDDDDYFHNYAGRQYWIDDDHAAVDFPSFPRLNEYFDSIALKFPAYIPLTEDEIAALIFGCGVAARQVYTSEVSGTFGVDQAFDAYQRFAYLHSLLIYDSDTSFYTHMKNNMKNGIPVHLALLSSTGSGGHNVVTDGYNTDNYYHLNFGWGGSYNGWYLLPDEIPYNLTIVEGAIMDIGGTHVDVDEQFDSEISDIMVYPNPSNGPLNISFVLDESTYASIEIRNMHGSLISNLHSGELKAGNHKILFDDDLNPGIYLLTIRSNNQVVAKMILIN